MNKTIKTRKTIFVVVQSIYDENGGIFDINQKAFYDENAANYYAERMNENIVDHDMSYHVEDLELLELV